MKTIFSLFFLFMLTTTLHAQETLRPYKNAFVSEAFQLNGYGQIISNLSQYPEKGLARTTSRNSFDVARAILFATGKLGAQQQFGYMLMYDFGPTSSLQELYGEWLPSDALNVRFGQYKIPFTMENPMSPTRIETVYFSRSAAAMAGSAGDFNQYRADGTVAVKAGRDAGLQLSGKLLKTNDFFRVEYYAGLFNGTGLNTKDNDSRKDFIGTIYYRPIKELRIGGSVYSGELTTAEVAGLSAGSHARNAWTVGAEFSNRHFYARSEYLASQTGNIRRQGGYASAVWKFIPDHWEVLAKYEFYDANTSLNRNEIQDYTLGVNWILAYLTRLQVNYIFTDDRVLGKNNALATQIQLFF